MPIQGALPRINKPEMYINPFTFDGRTENLTSQLTKFNSQSKPKEQQKKILQSKQSSKKMI